MNRRLFFKKFINFSFLLYTLSFAKNIFASWNEKAFNSENTDDSINKILNGAKIDKATNDMLIVDLPDIADAPLILTYGPTDQYVDDDLLK